MTFATFAIRAGDIYVRLSYMIVPNCPCVFINTPVSWISYRYLISWLLTCQIFVSPMKIVFQFWIFQYVTYRKIYKTENVHIRQHWGAF